MPRSGVDAVRADVLGDAARLASDDVRLANLVEERGLAVVDVTHDRDDRRPMLPIAGLVLELAARVANDFVLAPRDVLDLVVELAGEDGCGVRIERAVDVDARDA